jgi:hypothetical protein
MPKRREDQQDAMMEEGGESRGVFRSTNARRVSWVTKECVTESDGMSTQRLMFQPYIECTATLGRRI